MHRVPFSYFSLPELIFGSIDGVVSRFYVLRSWTHFRRCRMQRVPFSCFASPRLVFGSAECVGSRFHGLRVPTRLQLIFGNTEGVGSYFHVLCSRTRFRRCRMRRLLFSCFARPDSFSTVSRASGPIFFFCMPGLIFGGTKGVGSRFHVLCFQTRFRRCRVRRVLFSYFSQQLIEFAFLFH
jgi:hypothetical protein